MWFSEMRSHLEYFQFLPATSLFCQIQKQYRHGVEHHTLVLLLKIQIFLLLPHDLVQVKKRPFAVILANEFELNRRQFRSRS